MSWGGMTPAAATVFTARSTRSRPACPSAAPCSSRRGQRAAGRRRRRLLHPLLGGGLAGPVREPDGCLRRRARTRLGRARSYSNWGLEDVDIFAPGTVLVADDPQLPALGNSRSACPGRAWRRPSRLASRRCSGPRSRSDRETSSGSSSRRRTWARSTAPWNDGCGLRERSIGRFRRSSTSSHGEPGKHPERNDDRVPSVRPDGRARLADHHVDERPGRLHRIGRRAAADRPLGRHARHHGDSSVLGRLRRLRQRDDRDHERSAARDNQSPDPGQTFAVSEVITFRGESFDANEVEHGFRLADAQVAWYLDGSDVPFARGHAASTALSGASMGMHTITFRGNDGELTGEASVTIELTADPSDLPPNVVITAPRHSPVSTPTPSTPPAGNGSRWSLSPARRSIPRTACCRMRRSHGPTASTTP